MDTKDTLDTIISFEDFADAVADENFKITNALIKAETKVTYLTSIVDKQTAELEARKLRIEQLESALTFSERGKSSAEERVLMLVSRELRSEEKRTSQYIFIPADDRAPEQEFSNTALEFAGAAE